MAASCWNVVRLCPPKRVLCAYTALELIELGDLDKISDTLNTVRLHLMDDTYLKTEIAVFDRLHYKFRRVFNSDKQMHAIRKVRNCLNRFCRLDVANYCTDVRKDLDNFTIKDDDSRHVYLPSRRTFLYILMRLQGVARLLVRTVASLQESFHYVLQKIYLGHYVNANLLFLVTISRLWVLIRGIAVLTHDWCSRLKPFVFKLKVVPEKNVPHAEDIYEKMAADDFSDDISKWLGVADIKAFFQHKTAKPSTVISKSLDHLLAEDNDEDVESENKQRNYGSANSLKNAYKHCNLNDDSTLADFLSTDFDCGVSLSREEFKAEKESRANNLIVYQEIMSIRSKKKLKELCSTLKLINDVRFSATQRKKFHRFLARVSSKDGSVTLSMASVRKRIAIFWKRPRALDKYSLKQLATTMCLSKKQMPVKKPKKTSKKSVIDGRAFKNNRVSSTR